LLNGVFFGFGHFCDGSGGHAEYSHLGKTRTTGHVFASYFTVNSIYDANEALLWDTLSRGHNSIYNIRPIALFPEKESDHLLEAFAPLLEQEIKDIKANGLRLTLPSGQRVFAKLDKSLMSMADGKIFTRLLQLEGAYCTMCDLSSEQAHDIAVILEGFTINRTIEGDHFCAGTLIDMETREIPRACGDYGTRAGLTGVPITKAELTRVMTVCHAKIHCFDWVVNGLLVRQNS
jgi:hypothetical protein